MTKRTESHIDRFDRRLVQSTGATPEGELSARVEKTFRSAAWAKSLHGDPSLTILRSDRSLVPNGLVLPRGAELPLEGSEVKVGGGVVSVTPPGGTPVRFALRGCGVSLESAHWSAKLDVDVLACQLPLIEDSLPREARSLLALAEDPAPQRRGGGKVSVDLAGKAAAGLAELGRFAFGSFAPHRIDLEPACLELLGLGWGSTPTGDDLLTGAAAVFRRLCVAGHLAEEVDAGFRQTLQALPLHWTTPVSAEMLRWAASGVFAKPLADLLSRCGDAHCSHRQLFDATGALLAVGGSSGRDSLCGVTYLLRRLVKQSSQPAVASKDAAAVNARGK